MIAEKYNEKTKEYEKITLPGRTYLPCTDNMNALTTCPGCNKMVPFGATYTSRVFFFNGGNFGIPVCEKCHDDEYNI